MSSFLSLYFLPLLINVIIVTLLPTDSSPPIHPRPSSFTLPYLLLSPLFFSLVVALRLDHQEMRAQLLRFHKAAGGVSQLHVRLFPGK